jgi:hypothetical protein
MFRTPFPKTRSISSIINSRFDMLMNYSPLTLAPIMDLGEKLQAAAVAIDAIGLLITTIGTYIAWHTVKGIPTCNVLPIVSRKANKRTSSTPAMGAADACASYAQPSSPAASGKSSTSNDSSIESPTSIRIRQANHCHCRVFLLTVNLVLVRLLSHLSVTSRSINMLHRSEHSNVLRKSR